MRLLRVLALCVFTIPFLSTTASVAQPTASVRITAKIDESQLVTLKGNTLPAANTQNDLGRVSSSLPMTNLLLVLSRSAEQQAAFDEFVASQYDASSPNFHHWLLPAQVGEKFGPSLADIATVSNWLSSHGFTVGETSKDRLSIRFSGTAGQVESTFHTEVHNLSVNGEKHIANMSDPRIPAALAPVVAGIKALHDFRPRPLHKVGGVAMLNKDSGKWQRVSGVPSVEKSGETSPNALELHPQFWTPGGTASAPRLIEDLAPYDFATIYNVLPLWNASTPIDGTGQTIAIAGTSDIKLSDVSAFRSAFGLPAGSAPIQVDNPNHPIAGQCTAASGTANCTIDDLTENTLDVEWAGAVAPGAQIVLVTSGQSSSTSSDDTVYESSNYVVQNIGNSAVPALANASILNVSYGACELQLGAGSNSLYNSLWQSAAAEGIAVIVSAGDGGSADCDETANLTVPPPAPAQLGLAVNGLASTPYDTAVGGTDLNWGVNANPYWGSSNSGTNATAIGYVPEVPWNNTCTNPLALSTIQLWAAGLNQLQPQDAASACQFIYANYTALDASDTQYAFQFADVVGGGGGASNCTSSSDGTISGCDSSYSKPTWQAGVTGIPADGVRDLPDVSFFAGNGLLGSSYLICVSAALPVGTSSCSYTAGMPADLLTAEEVGGTSVAAATMSGVMALINQKAGIQGSPNAELYSLAARQNYASCSAESVTSSSSCYFNDIDTGTISMPCTGSTTDCATDNAGDAAGALRGYDAATAYDQATGLGSLNVANIVNAWVATTGTAAATITANFSASTINIDASLTITGKVTGSVSAQAPTGNVTVSGGGYTSAATSLSGGSYSVVIPANSLSAGTDPLTVSYAGDFNYATVAVTVGVTVNKLAPTLTVSPASSSVAVNSSLVVSGAVSGAGLAPTGSVTLTSGSYTSTATTLSGGSYTIVIPANSLSTGTDTLTVNYSGDGDYSTAANTAQVTVTAVKLAATVSVIPASTSIVSNTPLTVTGAVTGSGATPTGTVTLSSGSYNSGAINLSSGSYSVTIPANMLGSGTVTLTANYGGDGNYNSATNTATVTVTSVVPLIAKVTVTPVANPIGIGQSLNVTVAVAGAGATPTGSVTLSSGSYNSGAQTLASGSYTFTVPANSLAVGNDTLTATYSGDSVYGTGSGNASVTVTQSSYSLSASPNSTVAPGSTAITTVTALTISGYSGAVALTCALTTSPSGAANLPGCAVTSGSPIMLSPATISGAATLTVSTTAATTGALANPELRKNGLALAGLGGAALALMAILGIPAQRRKWHSLLGALALLIVLSGLAACGGSSKGSTGGNGNGSGGTSTGTYTFTVTGTGNDSATTVETTTFTLTVN